MPTFKAIKIAEEAGLDLVEVSPNGSNPVICKLMDYGRHRYENQKKQHKTLFFQIMMRKTFDIFLQHKAQFFEKKSEI